MRKGLEVIIKEFTYPESVVSIIETCLRKRRHEYEGLGATKMYNVLAIHPS